MKLLANTNKLRSFGDKLGGAISGACAVHCALAPILVTLAPLVGLGFIFDEGFEAILILSSFGLASLTIGFSFVKHHRQFLPMAVLLLGMALVTIAQMELIELPEPPLMALGGLSIMISHIINHRLCKSCHGDHDHCH